MRRRHDPRHPLALGRAVAAVALAVTAATPAGGRGDGAPLDPERLGASMARHVPFDVRVDLARLPADERVALERLVEAARIMDALYLRQAWGGNGGLLERLLADRSTGGPDRLAWFLWNKGPWSVPDGGAPFVPGVPRRPEAGTFYPPGAEKADVDRWLATLGPAERRAATSPHTVVRRGPDGRLAAVPYSAEYAPELDRAARLLREAAAATRQPTLRALLEARAAAFLSNAYAESDAALVDLDASIDAVLGPYEVDDDGWFGAKTAFEAVIAVRDDAATARLAALSGQLQSVEDRLPVERSLRGRRIPPGARVQVLDMLYAGGQADRAVFLKGYGLPNDTDVIARKGVRTVVFQNALRAEYEATVEPLARLVLAPGQPPLRFDDYLLEVLMVRLMDGLGPQVVTGTSRSIADAMQEVASPALQLKSMLLSLWAHEDLLERGVLDGAGAAALYPAFAAVAVARLRHGLDDSRARASTVILNRLLDAGGVRVVAGHRLEVDRRKASAAVRAQLREVVAALAAGDAAAIRGLLRSQAVLRPEIRSIVERLADLPTGVRPVFVTANALGRGRAEGFAASATATSLRAVDDELPVHCTFR